MPKLKALAPGVGENSDFKLYEHGAGVIAIMRLDFRVEYLLPLPLEKLYLVP